MHAVVRWRSAVVGIGLLLVAACSSPPRPGEGHGGGAQGAGGSPGSGGQTGAGGTGGSGGGGSGGSIPIPTDVSDWIGSEAGWLPVPGTEEGDSCELVVADPAGIPLPELRWEPCGTGCEFSRLLDGLDDRAIMVSADIEAFENGEVPLLIIRDAAKGPDGRGVALHRIVNLQDGKTLAAARLVRGRGQVLMDCDHVPALAGSFTAALSLTASDGGSYSHLGTFDARQQTWKWRQPRDKDLTRAAIMAATPGGRHLFFVGISNIVAMLGEGTERTVIEKEGYFEPYAIARAGAGIMWSKFVETNGTVDTEIRRWTEGSGLLTIFPRVEGITCALAWGDRWIVGMTGQPLTGACTGGITNPRFWLSPAAQSGKGSMQLGPRLVLKDLNIWRVATRGKFLAAAGYLRGGGGSVLILANEDQRTFRHIRGQGNRFVFDASINLFDNYLYFVEGDAAEMSMFHTVYRYDLSTFDQWFDAWGSPVEILQ